MTLAVPTLLPCFMHVPKFVLDPRALVSIRRMLPVRGAHALDTLNVRSAQHAGHMVVAVGHNLAGEGAEVGQS